MNALKPWITCRVCSSVNLVPTWDLGEQFVSDFVEIGEARRHKVPIQLDRCADCGLVQQRYTAPSDFMYTRHYWYRSGTSALMRQQLRELASSVERRVALEAGDVVLDIGSNDGTLLRSYGPNLSLFKVGVEPAGNLEVEGRQGVDLLISDFWSAERYYMGFHDFPREGPPRVAKVITAIGMFYDLDDPNAFIRDVAACLRPDGVFVAQLMCLRQTLEMADVGNLAHEHLLFYSLKSLNVLFGNHGLEVFDAEENKVNGGSYRLWVRHEDNTLPPRDRDARMRVDSATLHELTTLSNPWTYQEFWNRIEAGKRHTVDFIRHQVSEGKKVWAYGASTKGNVILQWYGLGPELIEGAADASAEKRGKFTVGSGIPIYSKDVMRLARPDFLLVLPYAFLDEFMEEERAWRDGGGRFIVPIPEFKVV